VRGKKKGENVERGGSGRTRMAQEKKNHSLQIIREKKGNFVGSYVSVGEGQGLGFANKKRWSKKGGMKKIIVKKEGGRRKLTSRTTRLKKEGKNEEERQK